MLDTLVPSGYERATSTPLVDRPPTPDRAPPIERHPELTTGPGRRSPRIVIAILAVVALVGVFGSIFGFVRADSARDDLTVAEQERDDALARVATAEQGRDDALARVATAESELDIALRQADTSAAEIESLAARAVGLDNQVQTLTTERDAALERATTSETEVGRLTSAAAQLDAQIESLTAERDALTALFPMSVDTPFPGLSLAGTYRMTLDREYCGNLGNCSTLLQAQQATITRTSEGWLRLTVPNAFQTPLYRVDGALHGVIETTSLVPAENGTPRRAYAIVTLYPNGMTVAADGTAQATGLGATFTIAAPATATAPAGLAFYGADLVRTS